MTPTYRAILISSLAAVLLHLAFRPRPVFGQPKGPGPETTAEQMMTPATRRAIDRGLAYLAARQNDDGSFGTGAYGRNVAICSLAGMAMIAGGSTPLRGPYGRRVSRCTRFILANSQDSGFINAPGASSHGPMYGHGFATLFLAEVYGMSPQPRLRDALSRATKLIINTQNDQGGWRYQPRRADADISVTICQIMALRAARNGGMFVPNQVVDRCIDYVKRSQNADGGFMYVLPRGASDFPRSAAGVTALYTAGIYKGEEIRRGLDYLLKHLPQGGAAQRTNHFFYGQYYAVQAMWQAGGDDWNQWYPAIRDLLVEMQQDEGYWTSAVSPEYGTAMATLILQMPNGYLPIFQR